MDLSKTIIMHARYEVVRNENGVIVDSICTDANKRFREFYKEENPIGKKRSELLYASNPLVCRVMQMVLATGESEVFGYDEEGLGCVDVIIEDTGDGKQCDVYTVDVEALKHKNTRSKNNLRKYAIASQLYGLAVWQWDIKQHKVFADNALTDLTGNEDIDMERDQIVWDEFERLDYIYEEDREKFANALYSMRDKEYTQLRFTFRLLHDGELHQAEARAIVDRFDKEGNPLGVLAVTRIVDGEVFKMPTAK